MSTCQGSPLVSQVLSKKRRWQDSRSKWKWAAANAAGAAFVFVELRRHFLLSETAGSGWRTALSTVETVLAVVFITNTVIDLVNYFFPFLSLSDLVEPGVPSTDLVLTKKQMDLFGVPEGSPGFILKEEKKGDPKNEGHPFGFSPPLDGSFVSPAPGPSSPSSPTSNYSSASLDSTAGWQFYRKMPPSTPNATSNTSFNASLQKFSSKLQGEPITDPKSLTKLINEYEQWERSKNRSNPDFDASNSSVNNSSFWNVGQSPMGNDYSPYLRKMTYQQSSPMLEPAEATKSFQSPPAEKNHQSPKAAAADVSVCSRLGVTPVELISYLENLRMWISQTVLRRVIEEIGKTNDLLVKHGMSDERIGFIGVEKLKKVASMPHVLHHVPSLDALIPFLEFHSNQEYLVKRYAELSAGGAMSEFKWNSGGKFKGGEWHDKLPTDAEIVINSLASYLDTRLPSNFVSGKPFTDVYFLRSSASGNNPSKEESTGKPTNAKEGLSGLSQGLQALMNLQRMTSGTTSENESGKKEENDKDSVYSRSCVIVQTSQKPPQFEVHLKEDKSKVDQKIDKIKVGAGRNNLFHTILLFLHHIKTREAGTLERINFGCSGVNLLWVIGAKD